MTDSHPGAVRVLLVEDDPADAALVTHALANDSAAFAIHHVPRLGAVAHTLETETFDIIVTDLNLPDSDGAETVVALRTLAPSIPLVVLSGSDDEDIRLETLRLGAIDFVPKSGTFEQTIAASLTYTTARTRQQSQLHDLVEANSDGAVVVDRDGKILYVNRAGIRVLGRPRSELIGSRFGHPITDRSSFEIEVRDGSGPRTAEMRVVELDWGERGTYLVSIRDVTDRKRAAELERRLIHADRLASIGQLAAGVAHEINNPSTFIHANCAVMAEDVSELLADVEAVRRIVAEQLGAAGEVVIDEALARLGVVQRLREMGEMLGECVSGVKRITATVKDLSTFSRIERDEAELANVNHLVEVACNLVRADLRHRASLLQDLGELPVIVVDRAKLTQVFVNLLVNAGHALEDSRANTVTVTTRHAGPEIVIAIEDTGCGIAPRNLERIFEPFFTTKARDRGTGLGLALAAETVRKHRGEISVESEVGRGTRFEIRLPEDTGLTAPEIAAAAAAGRPAPRSAARLLIVDDEPLLRKAFRRVLTGHEVIEVDSGASALAVLREDRDFDMILCDLMMPNLDGPGSTRCWSIATPSWPTAWCS